MFESKNGETLTEARGKQPSSDAPEQTPQGPPTSTPLEPTGVDALPIGDIDRYRITDEHARGGLGRVLRAEDESLGRTVAVKELLARSPSHEQRFIREALITARLQHPSIVPVHEAGRWPSGEPYYVMKLIQGETLKEKIAAADSIELRLALLPNAIAVADAVAYAHSQHVIHRDLKPSNVVVGEFGETIVIDWGLAEDLGADAPDPTGDIVGTPAYMPPEQARGEPGDKRSDVYSLGALLYHLLTGEPPYVADGKGDRLEQVRERAPTRVLEIEPHTPTDLVAILEKAMARERRHRYRNAAELAADLKRFQTGNVVTAQHYSSWALVRRWLARYRAAVVFVGVTALITSVLGVLAIERIIDERNSARGDRAVAELARLASEARGAELLFLQAASSILSDPTAAVAWLRQYPDDGPSAARLPGMAREARSLGVARDVIDIGEWVLATAFVGSDHLVTADKGGAVRAWDLGNGGRPTMLEGHASPDPVLATSSQSGRVAYAMQGGSIHVTSVDGGATQVLEGHERNVWLLRFSRDGETLISSGADQVVRVWDAKTGTLRRELHGSGAGARGNVSRDGSVIAAMAGDQIRFRGPTDDRWRKVAVEPIANVRHFAVGETMAVVVQTSGAVIVIDLGSGEAKQLGVHGDPQPGETSTLVDHLSLSPSNRYVVTAGGDRTVRVWDARSGTSRVLRGHEDAIYMASFSPDETQLVSAGDDGTARLWNLGTGAVTVLRGHKDDVIRAVFSPDGGSVATASLDGTVRVWPTRFDDSVLLVRDGQGFMANVSFARKDELVTQTLAGELVKWNLKDRSSTLVGMVWPGDRYPDWRQKRLATVSPAGTWAAAVRSDGDIELWNIQTAKKRVLERPERVGPPVDIAFTPNEETVVATDGEGALVRYATDATGSGSVSVSTGDPVHSIGFAPDGTVAMTTASELVIAEDGGTTVRHRLRGSGPASSELDRFSVIVSPYGDRVAAFQGRGLLSVCGRSARSCIDLSTGGELVLDLAFSPDASLVAAACADRLVRVWSTTTGELETLAGHTDLVHAVAFSPSGQTLATASYDKTVRLWDLGSGDARVLRGHSESVEAVSFSPNGEQLASVGRDGTTRLWTLDASASDVDIASLTRAKIIDERPVSATP